MNQKLFVPTTSLDKALDSIHADFSPEEMQDYGTRMREVIKRARRGAVPQAPKAWDYHMVSNQPLVWIFAGCPWFNTGGGCSVCDGYGKNDGVDVDEAIEDALDFIRKDASQKFVSGQSFYTLNLGSSCTLGLPEEARTSMFTGADEILRPFAEDGRDALYLCESRLTDITERKIAEMRRYIRDDVRIEIGVGLEASSDFVRNVMINKGYPVNAISLLKQVVDITGPYNVGIESHSLLGIPGLTELESIASAVETTSGMIDAGVARAVLMTTNIKKAPCLASELYRSGKFSLPSVHATAEVIRTLNERGYYNFLVHGFAASDPTEAFAEGCECCTDRMRNIFDTYGQTLLRNGERAAADYFKTANTDCGCKEKWLAERMAEADGPILADRFEGWLCQLEERYGCERC